MTSITPALPCAMLEWAREFDQWLMLRVNHDWVNPVFDHVLPTLSSFEAWTPLLAIAVVILLWRGSFKMRAFIACAVIAVLASEGLVSGPLKKIVGRLRPHEVLADVTKRTLPQAKPQMLALFQSPKIIRTKVLPTGSIGHSFPSSHTCNLFAVAGVALAFFRARAWPVLFVAALVALSRIYCGVHWPSDVLGSSALGLLTGAIVMRIASQTWMKNGARWFPQLHAAHPRLCD